MQILKRSRITISLPLIVSAVILSLLGAITLTFSDPSFSSITTIPEVAQKHLVFIVLGVLVFIFMSRFDYSYIKYPPIIFTFYLGTITLLVLTLIFGEEVKGAQRWLSLGGVQLQPSEVAKLTVIVTTAYILSLQNRFNEYILTLISFILIIPIVLLIYLQPHGSMSLIIIIIWSITVFFSLKEQFRNFLMVTMFGSIVAGIWGVWIYGDMRFLVGLFIGVMIFVYSIFSNKGIHILSTVIFVLSIAGGLVLSYSWNSILLPYQKDRVISFLNPESADPSSTFNVEQAKIAIGSGQVFGKGFGNGTQASRDFLPEHQTDFLFASYAEQSGFVGVLFMLLLYSIILITIFKTPLLDQKDLFASSIAVAIGMKILLEIFINLGTNTGITPATGIPLPLMSAGGTITVLTFFSLGVIQSIMNRGKFIDN